METIEFIVTFVVGVITGEIIQIVIRRMENKK
jgi:hypothetical protein